MKIINIPQNTPEWLEFRRGKITGTKSSACVASTRKNADGSYLKKGWWELLAERLTGADEEDISEYPMARGHQLEGDCAEITVAKYKLQNPKYDCGIWQGDNEQSIVSPDCHEDSDKPTWAVECKALNSADHIKTIYRALEYTLDERPQERFTATVYDMLAPEIEKIPQEYREQALDYFIVNKDLKTLYFALYDPRFKDKRLCHWVFVIERKTITDEIKALQDTQELTLRELDTAERLIKKLLGGAND